MSGFSGCGIAGILQHGPRAADEHIARHRQVEAMTRALAHRGPNGEGLCTDGPVSLGHRRLSLLDLSDAGAQPMTRDHLTVVYNGELYNFADLRAALTGRFTFTSGTDTEVLLRAWQHWGPAALDRLDGMYAFALWDARAHTLHLVRDRLGIKPLYYHRAAGGDGFFAFASEVQALLRCPRVPRQPDLRALYRQLLCSSTLKVDLRSTLLQHVQQLPPGSWLSVHADGRIAGGTYWRPPNADQPPAPRQVAAAQLGQLLHGSVAGMLTADVPVATFLSGGLDSSAITALAADIHPVTAITVTGGPPPAAHTSPPAPGIVEGADLHFSRLLTADQPRISHHVRRRPSGISLADIDAVCDLAVITEDPRHLDIYANYQAVADLGLRAVLNGQGADELMGGYVRLPSFTEHIYDLTSPSAATIAGLPRSRQAPGLSAGVLAHQKQAHLEVLDLHRQLPGSLLERAHRLLLHSQLSRIVQFEDFLSMAAGVEARFPYLSHPLVEWCFHRPFEAHIDPHRLTGKAVLRRTVAGLVPDPIRRRAKQVFPHPNPAGLRVDLTALAAAHEHALRCDELVAHLFTLPAPGQLATLPNQQLWLLLATWRWHHRLQTLPTARQPTG